MKRMLLCILLFPCLLNAKATQKKYGIGFTAGFNFANIYTDHPFPHNNLKIGPIGGCTLEYSVNNIFQLQSGIHYVNSGAKSSKNESRNMNNQKIGNWWLNFDIKYIEIPIRMKLNYLAKDVNL